MPLDLFTSENWAVRLNLNYHFEKYIPPRMANAMSGQAAGLIL
jgi:hypothetical protein